MEGILKDIFYAIKDLNVKEDYKPILIDKSRMKEEDIFDLKIELKDLNNKNRQL